MDLEGLFIVLLYGLILMIIVLIILVIVLALIGKSLGIRKQYIRILLHLFEFGRKRIDSYAQTERQRFVDDGMYDSSGDEGMPGQVPDTSQEIWGEVIDDGSNQVITRDISISATEGITIPSKRKDYDMLWRRVFHVSDIMYFAKHGAETIIQDDVTQRFSAEELQSWNLLTRTKHGYEFISVRLTVLWFLGCFGRYAILLPFRCILLCAGVSWLIILTFLIGYIPSSRSKRVMNRRASLMAYRVLCRAMSADVRFHNIENRASTGICVANHTSPIDVVIMSCDNCYAMVGQSHTGFLGIMQRALSRATSHIWFERSELKDRYLVSQRMKDHVDNKDKLPILIFPEGTCINNTSVMMFKKGGFEVCPVIYPVAIKYDSRFADAFWNSSSESMVHHIFNILTSWALVVDIWYLPPMTREEGEDSVQFAGRVKSAIANAGGLVDLEWDGQLKRTRAKSIWKCQSQKDYSSLLKMD